MVEFFDAVRHVRPSGASWKVSDFSTSFGNFFDKYRREESVGVLESADNQPTSLLPDYLVDKAEQIGAIEPLSVGGFAAKLATFRIRIENKKSWVQELGRVLDRFRGEHVPYNESDTVG